MFSSGSFRLSRNFVFFLCNVVFLGLFIWLRVFLSWDILWQEVLSQNLVMAQYETFQSSLSKMVGMLDDKFASFSLLPKLIYRITYLRMLYWAWWQLGSSSSCWHRLESWRNLTHDTILKDHLVWICIRALQELVGENVIWL